MDPFPPSSKRTPPTSLAVLMDEDHEPERHPTPTSSSSSSTERSSSAQLLEHLTAQLVQRVSDHEWDHSDFVTYMVDDYCAHQEYYDQPIARSRDEYLANYRAFVEANPNYAIRVLSVSASVNDRNGTAAVWLHLLVQGHPTNVWRESVTVVYWRRKQGNWKSHRQRGVRGVGWFPG